MDKQQYSLWQTVFTVMILVPLFLGHSHAVDPAHRHASAMFRLSMIVIGVIGSIIVYFLKQRRSRAQAAQVGTIQAGLAALEWTRIPDGDAIEWSVNDRSTRADFWRCNLYCLTHRVQTVAILLATPLLFSCIFGLPFASARPALAGEIALGVFLAWFVFLTIVSYLDMRKRYPQSNSERHLTTTLTRMGFEDLAPEKSVFVPWGQVISIREHGGDVYIWRSESKGNYITRNAFANALEAREFMQKAIELWKNPMPVPANAFQVPPSAYLPTVWPPPPQA